MIQKQEILKKRAEALAKVLDKPEQTQDELKSVVFLLANEKYAIEMQYVREVSLLKEFTELPCVPKFIYGLLNLRRQILPIIDLRALFELPIAASHVDTKVIILKFEDRELALITDHLVGMQSIMSSTIQLPLPTQLGPRQAFLKGITNDGIILLDGAKLLTSKLLEVNEEMNGDTGG